METETKTRVSMVRLASGGIVVATARQYMVLRPDELRDLVQQAHDVHGIVADPFATPGSAEVTA
jgi:hypothetical protein